MCCEEGEVVKYLYIVVVVVVYDYENEVNNVSLFGSLNSFEFINT